MDDDQHTVSALSTEHDDLTVIFPQTGLPGTHNSRSTDEGFVVKRNRLPNCVPTPVLRKALTSWIWDHGHPISRINDEGDYEKHWLCKICYTRRAATPIGRVTVNDKFMMPCASTTRPARHMKHHGYNEDGSNLSEPLKKRKNVEITNLIEKQQKIAATVFDRKGWQSKYVSWMTSTNTSLRAASSKATFDLLTFHQPQLEQLAPRSHNTSRTWLIDAYNEGRSRVVESIRTATSRLTISFDGWTANNDALDVLGVVAHYLDKDHTVKTVVLGMRDMLGSHTGDNIADHLADVLSDFEISGSQVAYYASDNATNNDSALRALNDVVTVDPVKQRLRCTGHIYNLVCNAILYGVDAEASEDAYRSSQEATDEASQTARETNSTSILGFDTTLRNGSDEEKLIAWRRKGPIGKLHNVMVHIKGKSRRRTAFEKNQLQALTEVGDDAATAKIYRVVVNGGIRWNSTYLMIKRAIKLKNAIQLYQSNDDGLDEDDVLTKDDWIQLTEMLALLEPIYEASLHVQSTPDHLKQTHGALHEVLTSMDYILTTLEAAKNTTTYTDTVHFRTSVNLGWQKLDRYYAKTDLNPAYIMAVFLHPHYRQHWFEAHWKRDDCESAADVVNAVYMDAKRRYNTCVPRRTSPVAIRKKELEGFAAHCNVSRRKRFDDDDDLDRWRHEEQAPYDVNPLAWWRENEHRYPILKHLAFDLLAAPASTAADERLFSIAGNAVNEERPHTQAELAQAAQCVRSWHAEGII